MKELKLKMACRSKMQFLQTIMGFIGLEPNITQSQIVKDTQNQLRDAGTDPTEIWRALKMKGCKNFYATV
jgi:hypothetical protein